MTDKQLLSEIIKGYGGTLFLRHQVNEQADREHFAQLLLDLVVYPLEEARANLPKPEVKGQLHFDFDGVNVES